ncbi:MAG: hypothetical protein QOI80_1883, partial [Solirubrobacteraceae bacterium]|nr:hypothetical protein [Solirubrobacteraceae bacterium]
ASAAGCNLVAASGGDDRAAGTAAHPLRTPQAVVDRLRAGQTGCLRGGVYGERGDQGYIARFGHGGRPGRPLTLRSYPGERATLAGVVYVTHDAPDVTLADLVIDDPTAYDQYQELAVEINATRTTLVRDEITTHQDKTCVILGAGDAGRAVHTVIRDSVLRDCGSPSRGLLDHAIYAAHATGLRVVGNVISGTAGYGVHLYPDAQRSVVRGNVMSGNGGGVIFAGEGDSASSRNRVERNVIVGSTQRPDISGWWSGRTGRNNVARRNCLSRAIEDHTGFRISANRVGEVRFADGFRIADAGACAPIVARSTASVATAMAAR